MLGEPPATPRTRFCYSSRLRDRETRAQEAEGAVTALSGQPVSHEGTQDLSPEDLRPRPCSLHSALSSQVDAACLRPPGASFLIQPRGHPGVLLRAAQGASQLVSHRSLPRPLRGGEGAAGNAGRVPGVGRQVARKGAGR